MRQIIYTNPLGAVVNFSYSPYLIESLEGVDGPTLDIQAQKSPYQDGDTWLDALYEPRVIILDGKLNYAQSFSNIDTARRFIQSVINPKLGPGTLTVQNNNTRYTIPAICSVCLLPNKLFTDPFQQFHIEFTCDDPYFRDFVSNIITLGFTVGLLQFPVQFPQGASISFSTRSGQITQTATNSGDVPCPISMIINGPATNPIIYNLTTNQYMKFLTVLALGDQLIINTAFGNKTVMLNSGGGLTNAIAKIDLNSTFLQLAVGDNVLTYSDDSLSGSAVINIGWSNRFIGI